jgi:hypothetical protein
MERHIVLSWIKSGRGNGRIGAATLTSPAAIRANAVRRNELPAAKPAGKVQMVQGKFRPAKTEQPPDIIYKN